jgi:hypothetical protein
MDPALKVNCARCSGQNSTMTPMVGSKYMPLWPSFNKAVRAWLAWERRVRNEGRTNAQRVAAYEEFNDANEAFKAILSAFQHNRNKHVDNLSTPHHKRGGGSSSGGGFDPTTLGVLNRLTTAVENLVDIHSLVSDGSAATTHRLRRALSSCISANLLFSLAPHYD